MKNIYCMLLLALAAIAGEVSAQDITPSTITDDGQFAPGSVFYRIKFTSPEKYAYIDGDVKCDATADNATLFAFVGDATNGYRIYAKGNTSQCIYLTQTTTESTDNVQYGETATYDTWKIGTNGAGYYIYQHGPFNATTPSVLNYMTSGTLYTWNSGSAVIDNNCRVAFEAVEMAVLYNYGGFDKTVYATIGSEYPDPTSPASAYCTISGTKPEGNVTAGGTSTADFSLSWTGPFEYSSTIDDASWYLMTIGYQEPTGSNTKQKPVFRYTTEGATINLPKDNYTFSYSTKDQWAFVGNPIDGFKMVSRSTGNPRLVAETTPGNPQVSSAALGSTQSELWDVYANPASSTTALNNGFGLKLHGTTNAKLNRNGANFNLAFWTGADDGSTFTVNQVELPELTFNSIDEDTKSYTTLYLDYPVTISDADVEIYTGQLNEDKSLVEMTKVEGSVVPAGQGVLLVHTGKATSAALSLEVASEPSVGDNDITGTTEAITLADETARSNYRVFGVSNDGSNTLGFYTPSDNITQLASYKAYLNVGASPVRGFVLDFDNATTGIGITDAATQDAGAVYDLSGRRVQHAGKGIYIKGGKKIYVK